MRVEAGTLWIDEGDVVTSAGISAGIDMSLHLIRRLAGAELAPATARQIDYRWQLAEVPSNSVVRRETKA